MISSKGDGFSSVLKYWYTINNYKHFHLRLSSTYRTTSAINCCSASVVPKFPIPLCPPPVAVPARSSQDNLWRNINMFSILNEKASCSDINFQLDGTHTTWHTHPTWFSILLSYIISKLDIYQTINKKWYLFVILYFYHTRKGTHNDLRKPTSLLIHGPQSFPQFFLSKFFGGRFHTN